MVTAWVKDGNQVEEKGLSMRRKESVNEQVAYSWRSLLMTGKT